MGSRVYVGRLSYRAHERDIERFFRGYGRITEILLKNGYAFVEFSDRRDAEDAVHDLNGRSLLGDRVIVQNAKSRPRGRDMYRERMRERSRSRDRRRSRSRDRKRSHSRDRKKRRHSSSESESPEDNRRRSSSRSQSLSPKKNFKKSGSDRKRKRDRSSSSRSPSPDAKKSKDKHKERKYRSSSEKEGSADRGGANTCSIIVRGFDNKGKFEKRLKHIAKKYGDLTDFEMRDDNTCLIGYTSRESATKALEKMSGKEVDGQTVQVAPVEEKQAVAGSKNSETTKETERSPSEERSRSRTNSGSSAASGDEEKKNGSVDGNERSVMTDSHKKAKNGEEHIGNAITANTRNNRKRASGANEDGEKNGDDSETSNDAVTPELKKKKSDTEETETTEVDSTAAVGAE
ncbi:RNA recognition motif family protein [Acanthocheilonema viteae]